MHVPQSIQTAMELKYLAAIPHHMISPSTNSPIIKPSQDNLLGLFKITGDGVVFTQVEAGHLLSGAEAFNGVLPEPAIKNGKYIRWTGKQIYSVILPPISLSADPKSDKVPKVIIDYGIMKQGQIDKSVSGKILQAIHSDYGSKEAERYMNDLQIIISRYLIKSGFSVGVSDLVVHPDIVNKNREAIKKAVADELELAKRVHLNILDDISGNLSEVYEGKVSTIGNTLDKQVIANTVNTLDYKSNRILFMVTSGAKGSDTNIKQMMCCLGQQNIDGGRVPIGFTDRTLPHYPKYENGMESRGFIAHNFFEGLNPMEFYFHAMSGREGLIDTAVKTANSGYLQRRLVKTMEDLKTYHDYTIRDNSNEIIEFIYGNDGFDAVKIETQSTNFKLIKEEKLFKDFLFMEDEAFEDYMLAKSVAKMRESPNWFKKLESYNKSVQRCIDMIHVQMVKLLTSIDDLSLYYPVNMKKLVAKTMDVYSLDKITTKSELLPTEIIDALEQLIDDCRVNGLRNHVLEILVYDFMSPKKLIRDLHITRVAFEFMLAQVRLGFRKGRVEAGEMVGPLAAQSIGERSTQLTLNSVDWETDMLLAENGHPFEIKMGKFIDDLMDKYKDSGKIQHIPENRTEYLELETPITVPSVDDYGNMSWCQVTAVTRHLPVGDLVKITTESGREVSATQQKSFLVWSETEGKLVQTNGSDLKVGDLVPVTCQFPEPEQGQEITHLDFAKYLSKREYLFGSDYHKAGELYDADTRTRKIGFWAQHQGNTFTIPYNRLDTFVDSWRGKKRTVSTVEKGYIYPKQINHSHSKIPERIPLDEEFGFIIGLYLAEGHATDTYWCISNNDECIRKRVIDWCEKLSLTYEVQTTVDKVVKKGKPDEYILKGTSTMVHISGVFWPRFLKQWVGSGSAHKCVPAEAYVAPKPFVKGLLDGYISGDGCVQLQGHITASSVSKDLIIGISNLLTRFNIFGRLSTYVVTKPEGHRIKTENCLPNHMLYIGSAMSKRFATEIGSTHPKKHDRLTNITLNKNNKINTKQQYRYEKDVVLDKIIDIKFIKPTRDTVYDFTVPKTLNFTIRNGLAERDTFHTAGVGGAGKVTQGVPRLNEMLKVTKNPKQPSNIIYMNDTDRFDRERSERVKNSIEQTKIGQILKSDPAFYLEPTNKLDNVMEEDRAFMKFYEVFAELNPAFKEIPKNPWVIRLEFDRKEMVMRNVSMDDVHKILKDMYPESSLMYSDDNAGKLVFRLRMPFETRENVEDDFKYLKNKVAEIKKIIIKGVDNIEQVYLSEPSKDCILKGNACKGFSKVGEVYEVKEEYSMSTDGANLFDLLCRDDVDATRTYSIDPNEMNSIFGIEAAKLIVEQQFRQIMTGSSAMTSPRHVSLLVDKMTHSGEFMSVDRHGISKEDIGPLAKCSFEKTPDELREAALFGEIDRLKGVSANIMVGQIPECGTGTIKLFLDEEMLQEELAKRGNLTTDLQTELSEKDIFNEFQQKMCINEDDQININLKTIHTDGLSLSQIPDVMVD